MVVISHQLYIDFLVSSPFCIIYCPPPQSTLGESRDLQFRLNWCLRENDQACGLDCLGIHKWWFNGDFMVIEWWLNGDQWWISGWWFEPLWKILITMENHHVYWVNQLFLWPFSIAMLNYQSIFAMVMWLVVLTCFNHLEKYEFVNGKNDIPYMKWTIKHVWNHQAVINPSYENHIKCVTICFISTWVNPRDVASLEQVIANPHLS